MRLRQLNRLPGHERSLSGLGGYTAGNHVSPGRHPVSETSAKQRVVEALQNLPEDATVEEAMERLYFLAKVERGLDDAQAGRSLPHEEIRRRFLK